MKKKGGSQSLLPISFIKNPTKKSRDKHRRHDYYQKKKTEQQRRGGMKETKKKRRQTPAGTKRFIQYMKQQYGDDVDVSEETTIDDNPVTEEEDTTDG